MHYKRITNVCERKQSPHRLAMAGESDDVLPIAGGARAPDVCACSISHSLSVL